VNRIKRGATSESVGIVNCHSEEIRFSGLTKNPFINRFFAALHTPRWLRMTIGTIYCLLKKCLWLLNAEKENVVNK